MDSFFMLEARPLVQDSPTMRLHDLIDWMEIARKLQGLYKREATRGGGPEPYAPLAMFKAMLLGQWHSLSDTQLEQALRMRLDFMVFAGFEPVAGAKGNFPDATTLCRFRNRLVQAKLDQVLLRRINSQLEGKGLKVASSRGAILDATIIEAAARPDQHVDVDDQGNTDVVDSADAQARWVKKGQDAFFGYRGYAAVDSQDGYVDHVEVHPANEAEVNKLPGVVQALTDQGIKPKALLADKGYASKANREHLKANEICDLIQFKGSRGHPVHPLQTQMNKAIATLRYKVEQAFGTMKRRFGLGRARYFGAAKTQAQMAWAALGMNLLKALRKLQSGSLHPTPGSSPS
jgi:transposase, IS5 family